MAETKNKASTLVTVCVDNDSALSQAVPLILSFASVGCPPSVYCEISKLSTTSVVPTQLDQLQQLSEFGVEEIFADERTEYFLTQHCPLLGVKAANGQTLRALQSQAHAIYAF